MLLTMVEKLCVSLTLKKKKVCYARWPRHTKITMKNAKGVRKKFRVASCSVQGPHPSEQKMEKKKVTMQYPYLKSYPYLQWYPYLQSYPYPKSYPYLQSYPYIKSYPNLKSYS